MSKNSKGFLHYFPACTADAIIGNDLLEKGQIFSKTRHKALLANQLSGIILRYQKMIVLFVEHSFQAAKHAK